MSSKSNTNEQTEIHNHQESRGNFVDVKNDSFDQLYLLGKLERGR
jgi:hypothetical protein